MKIDRISYQKIFPTGMAYLNHKIGVEIQLNYDEFGEGDNPDEAFKLAKETVERWNLESNPGMAVAMEYMNGNPGAYSVVDRSDPKKAMEADIISCGDIEVLKTYKLLVKGKPDLEEAYKKKLKELSE